MRRFPDLDLSLEMMLRRMVGLVFIEVSAFHTFAWAEEVLSDGDLVAGDGEAAALVSYVRADETPHVDYLRTALTEIRDRTFVGESGAKIAGAEVIGRTVGRSRSSSRSARTARTSCAPRPPRSSTRSRPSAPRRSARRLPRAAVSGAHRTAA